MNTRGEESTDFCTGSRNTIERYTERREWCPRTSGRAPPGRRSRSLERQVLLLRHAAAFLAARAVKKCWLRSAAGVPTRTHFTLTTTHTHTIDTVPPPPPSPRTTPLSLSLARNRCIEEGHSNRRESRLRRRGEGLSARRLSLPTKRRERSVLRTRRGGGEDFVRCRR